MYLWVDGSLRELSAAQAAFIVSRTGFVFFLRYVVSNSCTFLSAWICQLIE